MLRCLRRGCCLLRLPSSQQRLLSPIWLHFQQEGFVGYGKRILRNEEAIRLARKHLSDDLPRQYDVIYGAEEQKFQVDEIVIFVGRFAPKTTPQTGK